MTTSNPPYDELWERIHAALDERLDPLDDPELAAAIAEAPELAQELVQLIENLERLSPPTPRAAPALRPRRSAALVAVAASCLLAFGTWRLAPGLETTKAPAAANSTTAPTLPLRMAAARFELIFEHSSPAGVHRLVHTNSSLRTEFESRPPHRLLDAASTSIDQLQVTAGDLVTYEHTTAHPFSH